MSLSGLDFSALSYNAAKWPWPARVLLGCALGGLVLLVGEVSYLGASRERLHGLEAREQALREQIEEKAGVAADLEAYTERVRVMEDAVADLQGQLPGDAAVPALLEDIARLAVAKGVWVEGIAVLDEAPQPFHVEQPLKIDVTGPYHDLAAFVSALGGLQRIVTVHDLALRPEGTLLRLDLLAKTYRRASQEAGVSQAVIPAPRFVYNSASLRDPFQLTALQPQHRPGRPALAPDLTRPRGLLEGIAIDQFDMVGTLSGGGRSFALLRAGSTVHRLAVGDYLGPDHGQVTSIQDRYVELVERFPDEQGLWLERPRILVLNVNS
ncbi:pilus assembly protein PilP [Pseudomonas orientalis]|uniref:Type IV pilus assembly protein PilO n=1 Tax=Pseudomonas orientalis TaxID=76758 RepID=A0A1H2GZC8_9PSED|nr:pilus assembly protein PilP [Pseudomonas orientalis]KRP64636.1 pilus assembly protein [Pseudomonas orientalis]SDU24960.1 type IV pilus assembly protein PilO [Pseudomonas orientalis]